MVFKQMVREQRKSEKQMGMDFFDFLSLCNPLTQDNTFFALFPLGFELHSGMLGEMVAFKVCLCICNINN